MKKRLLKSIRSQVTVFIIIGLIVLFSTAIVLYINNQAVKYKPPIRQIVEELPTEYEPIRDFISQCVQKTAEDAVQKLASGGYIDINDARLSGTTFKVSQDNTESDVLTFLPGSTMMIPYWWYLSSKNSCTDNCIFSSKMPKLYKSEGTPNMESQIIMYVENNIKACLGTLPEFTSKGFSFEEVGRPKANVAITELGVDVQLNYPLKVKKADTVQTMSKFFATLDVNLKSIYTAAQEIMKQEVNKQFLEKNTLNLMAGFSSFDENMLPPIAGYSIDCGKDGYKRWIKSEVKENLFVPMLMSYIPMIKFYGSSGYAPYDFNNDGLRNSLYNYGMTMLTDPVAMSNVEANAVYLGWNPYFDVNPSRGEVISPSSVCLRQIINVGFVEAKFAYDVSYPVLFELKDPKAFSGRGYTFYFAMESNIRRNEVMNTTDIYKIAPAKLSPIGHESTFCDQNQRMSGDILIRAKDAKTELPLEGVSVDFCIPGGNGRCDDEQDICDLGYTKTSGNQASLKQKLPLGAGLIRFFRQGYHSKAMVYATSSNRSDTIDITLEPIRTTKIKIVKKAFTTEKSTKKDQCDKDIDYYPWAYPSFSVFSDKVSEDIRNIGIEKSGLAFTEKDLESDETTVVTVTRTTPSYEQLSSFASVTGDEQQTLDLIPGDYTLSVDIMKKKELVIPSEEICYCDCAIGLTGCKVGICEFQSDTMNESKLPSVPLGGAKVNFTIGPRDLDRGQTLTIYAITPDFSGFKSHENLGIMGKSEELSAAYIDEVRPLFR